LQGIVSIQVWATPTIGFSRSRSSKPIALSIARAPARSRPFEDRAALMPGIGGLHMFAPTRESDGVLSIESRARRR
jgi:hypothetical protein